MPMLTKLVLFSRKYFDWVFYPMMISAAVSLFALFFSDSYILTLVALPITLVFFCLFLAMTILLQVFGNEVLEEEVERNFAELQEAIRRKTKKADVSKELVEIRLSDAELKIALVNLKKMAWRLSLEGGTGTVLKYSFIGGLPMVPRDFNWPRCSGELSHSNPLHFLMQIDFEELANEGGAQQDWPRRGILYFFIYCDEAEGQIDLCETTGSDDATRLIFVPDPSELMTATIPKDMVKLDRQYDEPGGDPHLYRRRSLAVNQEWSLPDENSFKDIYERQNQNANFETGTFDKLTLEMTGNNDRHAHANGGIFIGGHGTQYRGYRRENFDKELLLQIHTGIGKTDLYWGDSTVLQFWITPEDLKAESFRSNIYCYAGGH